MLRLKLIHVSETGPLEPVSDSDWPGLNSVCRVGVGFDALWCLCMMTSSNGNIFRVTGPLCGEFTGLGEFPEQRLVTRSFDIFFDLRLNKQLSKQPPGWWFGTPLWSLWRQCNGQDRFSMWRGGGGASFCTTESQIIIIYRWPLPVALDVAARLSTT